MNKTIAIVALIVSLAGGYRAWLWQHDRTQRAVTLANDRAAAAKIELARKDLELKAANDTNAAVRARADAASVRATHAVGDYTHLRAALGSALKAIPPSIDSSALALGDRSVAHGDTLVVVSMEYVHAADAAVAYVPVLQNMMARERAAADARFAIDDSASAIVRRENVQLRLLNKAAKPKLTDKIMHVAIGAVLMGAADRFVIRHHDATDRPLYDGRPLVR